MNFEDTNRFLTKKEKWIGKMHIKIFIKATCGTDNSETTFALINVTFEPRNESCKTHVAYKWVDLMCNLLVSSLLIKSVFLACLLHDDESHSTQPTVSKSCSMFNYQAKSMSPFRNTSWAEVQLINESVITKLRKSILIRWF